MTTTRCYRSKIGRLPWNIRNELNERLRDGITGPDILAWINCLPAYRALDLAPVTAQNLTDWRSTGYADWLRDQQRTAHLRNLAEFAHSITEQTGGDPTAVGSRILTGRLLDMLESADPQTAGDLVKAFSTLRNEESRARRVDLESQKLDLARDQHSLAQAKFQRDTCALFIEWCADQRARDIATSAELDTAAKTEQLGNLMFGALWEAS